MGKVFTPEAIVANDVPELGAHELAGKFILNQFFEPQEDWKEEERTRFLTDGNGIHSGMVYGSTALGRAGIRSDVDVLVNYHANRADEAFPLIRDVFSKAEADFKVPVEPHVLEVGALFNPLKHNIDPLFAEHLVEVQAQDNPRWSYSWPVNGLRSHRVNPNNNDRLRAIAVRYASGKARQFARASTSYRGEADVHVMQRALELPGAIGRKVIAATRKNNEQKPDLGNKYGMSKSIIARLEEFAPEWYERAVSYQRYLFDLDQTYDQLLTATLEGSSTVEDYREWLEGNYLHACSMAFEVAHAWSDIVGNKIDIPKEEKVIASGVPYESLDRDVY